MRKWLLALLVFLGAGAAWWAAGLPRPGFLEADGRAGAPRLRTATLDRGSITAVVAATGTVNPVTLVQVGSQLSGQIRELLADFNSKVAADQPIAQLDTATLEARRAAAEADVHAAAAQITVSRAQAERAAADHTQARAQIEAVRAALLGAEASLRDAEVEAARTAELRARGVGTEREALRAGFTADRLRAAVAQAQADISRADAGLLAAVAAARTAEAQVEAAIAAREQRVAQLRQVEVDLRNENQTWLLQSTRGPVLVRQIAGLIARRIVGWKKPQEKVSRGERIGMIRFGSRTDLYVPGTCTICVQVGQRVKGGETVLATWPA